jgi:hypothetical protein
MTFDELVFRYVIIPLMISIGILCAFGLWWTGIDDQNKKMYRDWRCPALLEGACESEGCNGNSKTYYKYKICQEVVKNYQEEKEAKP